MSETQTQTPQRKGRSKIEHVHVDMPKSVWELAGEIAKRYGVGKIDVIKMLVYAEAVRLGMIGPRREDQ